MGEVLMQPMGGGVGSDDVTAAKAQVLTGYNTVTTDSDDEVVAGTMPNNGAMNVTLTPSGNSSTNKAVAGGYYSGGTITANGSASYSQGVSDADGRVNTSSASYNSGYANGKAVKKSTTLKISLSMWSSHNDEGTHWHADVSVNGSHVCGAEQGNTTGYYTVTL